MFVITVNKKKLVRMAALAVLVVAAGAAGLGIKSYFTQNSQAFAAGKKTKLSTTQEMVDYIAQKGFTADIQTARVSEVEIPKKFDDTFEAFNEKIKQTDGLSLERYKGDKVNKWTFSIIGYQNGEKEAAAVLLIKKEKLIGAYIIEQPNGIAKAMTAADTAAQKG